MKKNKNKIRDLKYSIILHEDEESGGYTVEVPDLPGCITEGDTFEEAIEMAKEAIEGFIEVLKMDNEPIPKPSNLEIVIKKFRRKKIDNTVFTTIKVAA
jgi:predicted RNase H-like HicB family nuclease